MEVSLILLRSPISMDNSGSRGVLPVKLATLSAEPDLLSTPSTPSLILFCVESKHSRWSWSFCCSPTIALSKTAFSAISDLTMSFLSSSSIPCCLPISVTQYFVSCATCSLSDCRSITPPSNSSTATRSSVDLLIMASFSFSMWSSLAWLRSSSLCWRTFRSSRTLLVLSCWYEKHIIISWKI